MGVPASGLLMDSAMAGDVMGFGLSVAPPVFGLPSWFGRLLGGAGSGRGLSFRFEFACIFSCCVGIYDDALLGDIVFSSAISGNIFGYLYELVCHRNHHCFYPCVRDA